MFENIKARVIYNLRRLGKLCIWLILSYFLMWGFMLLVVYFMYPDEFTNPELRLILRVVAFFNSPVVLVLANGLHEGAVPVRIIE